MSDFGTDLACVDDLTPEFDVVDGSRALCEALVRRLSTPRGGLFYDPSYGVDVRAWLHESVTTARLFSLRRVLETEVEKDERVLSASADIELSAESQTLRIRVLVRVASGSMTLVLSATPNAVTLLAMTSF